MMKVIWPSETLDIKCPFQIDTQKEYRFRSLQPFRVNGLASNWTETTWFCELFTWVELIAVDQRWLAWKLTLGSGSDLTNRSVAWTRRHLFQNMANWQLLPALVGYTEGLWRLNQSLNGRRQRLLELVGLRSLELTSRCFKIQNILFSRWNNFYKLK